MNESTMSSTEREAVAFSVRELEFDDGDSTHELLRQLHIRTYTNDEFGVTPEMLDQRFSRWSPEERAERLRSRLESSNTKSWVAVDANGNVIGMAASRVEEDSTQHLGALYVDTNWQGKGVAHDLIQKALEWLDATKDIYLGVVAYNERAKAFYRKWGFEEIDGSESMFEGMMPEVKMIRKGVA